MTNRPVDNFSSWLGADSSTSTTHNQTFYIALPPVVGEESSNSQDTGTFILFQLVYSTMNSWSHSVQCTLRIHPPATPDVEKEKIGGTVGFGAGDFFLSKDKLSVDVGSGAMKIERLDDGIRYKLVCTQPNYALDAILEVSSHIAPYEIGEGKAIFDLDGQLEGGTVSTKFLPRGKVSGSYTVSGVVTEFTNANGWALNAVSYLPQMVYEWNFLSLQSDKDCLMIYQATLADHYSCQGTLILDDKIESILLENKITYHSADYDEFSGYDVPTSITHELSGKLLDGSDRKVKISITSPLSKLLDKIDVLGELPYFVRVFIQTFITAPFCYQWIDRDVKAVIEIGEDGEEKKEIRGMAFTETSFLAHLPE